jgi:arylsulfatase A-like enzyme
MKERRMSSQNKQDHTVADPTCGDHSVMNRRAVLLGSSTLVAVATLTSQALAQAQKAAPSPAAAPASGRKPNILVIFGDDIGIPQISAYTMGMMGYRTPNIDRIAREGALFTDAYGQQSCTAGRASFILGQEPFRTGLLTIGMPGDPHGIQDWMPTIADAMKTQGYATGQFGKNHLGDRDEHLPTKHGFDEFFGNLYHLNAEEEPEGYFYPKDPSFRKQFGPRGVIKASADGRHRPAEHRAHAHSGRGIPRRCQGFHRPAGQGESAVLRLVQRDAYARLHAPEAVVARKDRQGHPR